MVARNVTAQFEQLRPQSAILSPGFIPALSKMIWNLAILRATSLNCNVVPVSWSVSASLSQLRMMLFSIYPMNLLSFSIGFQSCTLLLILRKYRFYNDVMQTLWHLIERDDTILLLKYCVQHGRSGLVDFKMEAVAGRTLFMFCGQCF